MSALQMVFALGILRLVANALPGLLARIAHCSCAHETVQAVGLAWTGSAPAIMGGLAMIVRTICARRLAREEVFASPTGSVHVRQAIMVIPATLEHFATH